MRFEDLDKRIKDAADQHHPAYDEKAWQKMEKLLDRYLPQPKKDRMRTFLVVLSALVIGGGAFLVLSNPWDGKSKLTVQPKQENVTPVQPKGKEIETNSAASHNEHNVNKETAPEDTPGSNSNGIDISNDGNKNFISTQLNDPKKSNHDRTTTYQRKPNNQRPAAPIGNDKSALPDPADSKGIADNSKQLSPYNGVPQADQIQPKDDNVINQPSAQANEVNKPEVAPTEAKNSGTKKNVKTANRNGFSFSVSAGPDVSKAGASKMGQTTLAYGAGVGYTLNRFTLRTGVYASKKIYWADPKDYSLSYVPPSTSQFEGADADCYVIEIPLKLGYNFGYRTKSNWFAGAGLSSYLMKRETYSYIYKTSSGGTYAHPHEVKSENKHYFSVLNLSGGYSHQLSRIFSISAEPYLEYPLTGIGEGKVNLKSAGILFTLGIKPFNKK